MSARLRCTFQESYSKHNNHLPSLLPINMIALLESISIISTHICLSIHPSIHASIHSVILSIYLPIYLPIYLSTYLSTSLSIYLSTYLPIYLPIYLSICQHLSELRLVPQFRRPQRRPRRRIVGLAGPAPGQRCDRQGGGQDGQDEGRGLQLREHRGNST